MVLKWTDNWFYLVGHIKAELDQVKELDIHQSAIREYTYSAAGLFGAAKV